MLDSRRFRDLVREQPFGGSLKGSQVAGMESILLAAPASLPLEHLAYCLATTFHETARTMQPIEEYGRGAGKAYGKPDPTTGKVYYGRGYVQLTWKTNYGRAGRALGLDLVTTPSLALNARHAARIMFLGMAEGWFTGKRLSDYFAPGRSDPVGARRVVNGIDKAEMIADYHRAFRTALSAAGYVPGRATAPPAKTDPPPEKAVTPIVAKPEPAPPGGFFARLGAWLNRNA